MEVERVSMIELTSKDEAEGKTRPNLICLTLK